MSLWWSAAVPALQGHIWAGGFARGELKGELFADVPDALAHWRAAGIKTYIYSSGSRAAQKDLLSCTSVGDLRPYLAGFFDTTSGPKARAVPHSLLLLEWCMLWRLWARLCEMKRSKTAEQLAPQSTVLGAGGQQQLPKHCAVPGRGQSLRAAVHHGQHPGGGGGCSSGVASCLGGSAREQATARGSQVCGGHLGAPVFEWLPLRILALQLIIC